jgi:hypothetical protein
MTLAEAIAELFDNYPGRTPGVARCELLYADVWRVVPLEWNAAQCLADLCEGKARMIDAGGNVMRTYPEAAKEHA